MSERPRWPKRERELAEPVEAFLASQGYRVWVDPDGSDFFDIVARRDGTIGLVELKIADGRTVLRQALHRRAWADWVAVAVPSRRLAERIAERPVAERGRRVGIWWVEPDRVEELRPARPLVAPGEADPFSASRKELARRLDLLESGELPRGVGWALAASARRSAPGGRGPRDWRIEEFGTDEGAGTGAPPATEGAGRASARRSRPSGRS